MTDDEMRVKIAEACGWTQHRWTRGQHSYHTWIKPNGYWNKAWNESEANQQILSIPDYLNDLNAMHEAEKTLNPDSFSAYLKHLQALTQSEYCFEVENRFHLVHATARQRAEAFIATWEQLGATNRP